MLMFKFVIMNNLKSKHSFLINPLYSRIKAAYIMTSSTIKETLDICPRITYQCPPTAWHRIIGRDPIVNNNEKGIL
jgi:hypothetical protein